VRDRSDAARGSAVLAWGVELSYPADGVEPIPRLAVYRVCGTGPGSTSL
jgi:hypothetical protein